MAPSDDLDVLLDLVDSQITYRSRYLMGVELSTVRDMVVLDPFNPRSVAFQLERLGEHLESLPVLSDDGMPEKPHRQIVKLTAEVTTAVAADLDTDKILGFEKSLLDLADAVAARYFPPGSAQCPRGPLERPRVIYDIHHVTTYEYGSPVKFAHCALRLAPIDLPGQTVLSTAMTIDPAPSQSAERVCFFGNRVTSITIATEHSDLIVTVDTAIDVDRAPAPQADATAPFEAVREEAFDSASLAKDSPAHFLHPSRFVPRFAPAADYARDELFAGPAGARRRNRADAAHPRQTSNTTPRRPRSRRRFRRLSQKRRGVCQDFAHIMIAGLRGLGLPAAYVSGYIRTIPPPGKKRLEGADAMHAWVSLWCGEDVGWVDLDPTNSMLIGNDHIVLAEGRDYADISPVAGIILGTARAGRRRRGRRDPARRRSARAEAD